MSILRILLFAATLSFGLISATETWAQSQPTQFRIERIGDPMVPRDRQPLGTEMEPQLPYAPPLEPKFDEVTYLKIDPPGSMKERIERLIHGIYIDIPPEYDHFGYEIRRRMAAIAGPDVINSKENLKGQIKNIKTAEIVLKYWGEALQKEIKAIEAEIEETDAPSSTRTSFKYHRGVAEAFLVEAQSWLRNNRMALEYLLEIGKSAYSFNAPNFTFQKQEHLRKYLSLHKARESALEQMKDYTPFRMMVY